MAVSLPNGVLISLATTYAAPITITGVSNAASYAQATATSHGLSNGDIIAVTSGWSRLNDRVVRVADSQVNTFDFEGIDSSSTTLYPAGTGTGSVTEITGWTQISQILELTTSGGDMQFVTYSFLENDFETQLPTQASPMSIAMTIADDPLLNGYIALKAAAESRAVRALKLTMPGGSIILFNGYVSFIETPTLTKNQVTGVKATFNLLSRPVRYAA